MNYLKSQFEEFFNIIENKNNVIIQIHINPDGDAVGSALALSIFLAKLNIKNSVISPNRYPKFLRWLHGSKRIIIATEQFDIVEELYKNADLIIYVDFNTARRAGEKIEKLILNSNCDKILIDHHPEPDTNCNLVISTLKTSSTAEVIFSLIKNSIHFKHIDKRIAEAIYTGMVTDTGSFSYSCNNVSTYEVLSELMKHRIDAQKIHNYIFDTFSLNRLKLIGHSLVNRLVVLPEYATSYIYLTKEDLKSFNYHTGDTEGIVNYGLTLDKIKFTAIFIEREDRIRISFRSKGNFDVNIFARSNFNGGGHKNAAGSESIENMENTIKYFISLLPNYQEQLAE